MGVCQVLRIAKFAAKFSFMYEIKRVDRIRAIETTPYFVLCTCLLLIINWLTLPQPMQEPCTESKMESGSLSVDAQTLQCNKTASSNGICDPFRTMYTEVKRSISTKYRSQSKSRSLTWMK